MLCTVPPEIPLHTSLSVPQVYLPVSVSEGKSSGSVIAVAEAAMDRKCAGVELLTDSGTFVLLHCPGGSAGDG